MIKLNLATTLVLAALSFGCSVPSITVNVPKELATSIDKLQQPVAAEAVDEPTALTAQRTMIASEPEAEVVIPHIEGAGQVGPTPNPSERQKATTKATPTPGPVTVPDGQTEFLYAHNGQNYTVFRLYNGLEGGKDCSGVGEGGRIIIKINGNPYCATPGVLPRTSPSPEVIARNGLD